jgi:hypothetical protein
MTCKHITFFVVTDKKENIKVTAHRGSLLIKEGKETKINGETVRILGQYNPGIDVSMPNAGTKENEQIKGLDLIMRLMIATPVIYEAVAMILSWALMFGISLGKQQR